MRLCRQCAARLGLPEENDGKDLMQNDPPGTHPGPEPQQCSCCGTHLLTANIASEATPSQDQPVLLEDVPMSRQRISRITTVEEGPATVAGRTGFVIGVIATIAFAVETMQHVPGKERWFFCFMLVVAGAPLGGLFGALGFSAVFSVLVWILNRSKVSIDGLKWIGISSKTDVGCAMLRAKKTDRTRSVPSPRCDNVEEAILATPPLVQEPPLEPGRSTGERSNCKPLS